MLKSPVMPTANVPSKPGAHNLRPYGRMRPWEGKLAAVDAYYNLNALAAIWAV